MLSDDGTRTGNPCPDCLDYVGLGWEKSIQDTLDNWKTAQQNTGCFGCQLMLEVAQYLSEKFYGGKGSDVAKFSLHRPMLPSHEELILQRQVPKSDSYQNFSVYTLSGT
jgi:hypothetical protein